MLKIEIIIVINSFLGLQMLLLQGQGYGEDVESVENLIRRHEEIEREVRVIHERSTVSITCLTNKKTHLIFILAQFSFY